MTIKKNPWQHISIPKTDYTVRRVAGSGALPLYWGKDSAGHCLFVIELGGDHMAQFRSEITSVHGITVDLRALDTANVQGLVLTLENQVDSDLFLGLCETMVSSLKPVTDPATALAVSLAHIKRWKAFLAGKKSRLLSVEEVRGLFGELLFLRSLNQGHLDERAAIDAWSGPEGGHQDFIFQNTAVEVKALSGRERSTVRISSEDQMETLCDELFLVIYRLSDLPDSDKSLSLNSLVHLIEAELSDDDAIECFYQRLSAYGYVEIIEYDKPKFLVTSHQAYRVTDGFPRLIRSKLPAGIVRLSYDVELEKIGEFECDPHKIGSV